MLNEFALLQAMEGIGAEPVREAGALLGYTGQKARKGRRKLWRTLLLLAAVIASLLGVIPCVGWIWGIFCVICAIMGFVAAINGEEKEVPLLGKIKLLK